MYYYYWCCYYCVCVCVVYMGVYMHSYIGMHLSWKVCGNQRAAFHESALSFPHMSQALKPLVCQVYMACTFTCWGISQALAGDYKWLQSVNYVTDFTMPGSDLLKDISSWYFAKRLRNKNIRSYYLLILPVIWRWNAPVNLMCEGPHGIHAHRKGKQSKALFPYIALIRVDKCRVLA